VEVLLGLLGALVGAIAAVGAQFVNSRSSLKLEAQKQLRTDVAIATRSLLKLLGAQQWLVWKALHDPKSVTVADVDAYEQQAQASLNVLFGDIGVLSATWPNVYVRYSPLSERLLGFDERIGLATIEFRSDPGAGVDLLSAIAPEILPYHYFVFEQVAHVVEGREVSEYNYLQFPGGVEVTLTKEGTQERPSEEPRPR
jgi:hypothetical protein